MLTVDVVTNIPTPNNADFFRAFSELVDLRVHFEAQAASLRSWTGVSDFLSGYESITYDGSRVGRWGFWTPRLIRSLRPDSDAIILSGSYTSPTTAYLLLQRPRAHRRLFWGERFMSSRTINTVIRKELLGRADSLLGVGVQAASEYRKVTKAPVHVLPYVCAAADSIVSADMDRIGFVGQLIPRKGIDLLFEACSRTGVRAIDVVGSGPMEATLRKDAARRGLSVTWHGECANSAIGSIRSSWAYQVVPSRYDGWGVVVNEALASGTPVVVSSNTGAVELVRDNVNGWIHVGGDVESLSRAIERARAQCAQSDVYSAAAMAGRAFAAQPAAAFLVDVLSHPSAVRSFVGEQWDVVEQMLRGRPDPDHGVPDTVGHDESPPR